MAAKKTTYMQEMLQNTKTGQLHIETEALKGLAHMRRVEVERDSKTHKIVGKPNVIAQAPDNASQTVLAENQALREAMAEMEAELAELKARSEGSEKGGDAAPGADNTPPQE